MILFFIIIYAVEFIGWVIQKTIYRSENTTNHSNILLHYFTLNTTSARGNEENE